MVVQAGQIGFFEGILIVIGLLWLFGFLRNIIYVPVVVKEKEKHEEEKKTKIDEQTTISKPKQGHDDEYTAFEEIKD